MNVLGIVTDSCPDFKVHDHSGHTRLAKVFTRSTPGSTTDRPAWYGIHMLGEGQEHRDDGLSRSQANDPSFLRHLEVVTAV